MFSHYKGGSEVLSCLREGNGGAERIARGYSTRQRQAGIEAVSSPREAIQILYGQDRLLPHPWLLLSLTCAFLRSGVRYGWNSFPAR